LGLYSCIAAICTSLASENVNACGDKYLRLAARLGPAYPAQHRASVLLYMPPESVVRAAASKIGLKRTLESAGHRVYTVEHAADLETTVRQRVYDIVIADGASAPDLKGRLAAAHGRPTVLPIFHHESKRQVDAARKQVGCLISSRERAYYAPAEVDHVMEQRRSAATNP
jgi:hypothetical protein